MTVQTATKIVVASLVVLLCATASGNTETYGNPEGAKMVAAAKAKVAAEKTRLYAAWKQSRGEKRAALLNETREVVQGILRNDVWPAWYGMPWTMAVIDDGLKPDAAFPGEPGKGISCSWFVVSTLENAGLRFVNRKKFAGTIAVHFQKSMTPNEKNFHRVFNATPAQLQKKFLQWGDGLYIIGLNCHIGFVDVHDGQVDFVHSNYISPWFVTREPLVASDAIHASQGTGYVVSALFKDPYLLQHWLSNTKIPFRGE